MPTTTLLEAFGRLEDPRKARGVRHPFAGMVVLTLLGMLARIREMEVLVRWSTANWARLREPLGFDRDEPPCATTVAKPISLLVIKSRARAVPAKSSIASCVAF